VRLPLASGTTLIKVQRLASADYQGEPGGTQFILLIGSDLRAGVGGSRGDALHVLAVNPKRHKGTIVNIPRDTCAAIPGYGSTKINAANAYGGPPLMAATINQMLGVHISYSVLVDFEGFGAIVNGVGGVTINVPTNMNDHYSGAVFAPGTYHVDGGGALAFSRDRHDFPNSDIKRTENQGVLLLDALRSMNTQANSAAGEFKLLALFGRHAKLDGVSLKDLYRLGRIAHRLDPAKVRNVVLPTGGGGCLSVGGDAASLAADLRDDAVLQSH
jgi:LCP family protein required for cell wall assembly